LKKLFIPFPFWASAHRKSALRCLLVRHAGASRVIPKPKWGVLAQKTSTTGFLDLARIVLKQ
jgi:hypothetical protein